MRRATSGSSAGLQAMVTAKVSVIEKASFAELKLIWTEELGIAPPPIRACSAPLKLSQILLEFWHLFGRDWDGSEALFGRRYIELAASD